MADEESSTSVELDAANKTFKISGKKTAELIAILSLLALGWFGWVLFEHRAEAKANGEGLHSAIREMVQVQREQTCLIGFPEDQREHKAEFCRRVAR